MNNVSKEKGEKFESIVEKIYIQIANNERIKAKVEKHVLIIGDRHTIFIRTFWSELQGGN